MVMLRTSYAINVFDSALLGPKVGHMRNAAKAMKGSPLVTTHLAASDAALLSDRDAWKAPWIACLSSLAPLGSVDDAAILDVVRANFPTDDAFQEPAPETCPGQSRGCYNRCQTCCGTTRRLNSHELQADLRSARCCT